MLRAAAPAASAQREKTLLSDPIALDVPSTASDSTLRYDYNVVYRRGRNASLDRILVGMHDYYTGLDEASFEATADFEIDGVPAGKNLASRFRPKGGGVFELRLTKSVTSLPSGTIVVSVKDRQGNVTRVERTFSVGD